MILTDTTKENLDNLRTALKSSRAVLVQGEVGCGKSILVSYIAEESNMKENLLQINVDDTFDSKDLLGKFSASKTPGAFEWVAGPLTHAVKHGLWILMEDIDLASFDVFSVILSLLESGTLFIPDKNELLKAHPNFKLIGTQQLYSMGKTLLSRRTNNVPFMELWSSVILKNIPPSEIRCIIQSTFPNIPFDTVERLANLPPLSSGSSLTNLHKLLDWSKRVSKRLPSANARGYLSSSVREMMFREAYDCFVAKFPPGKERDFALEQLCAAVEVSTDVGSALVLSKPSQSVISEEYNVGRVTLKRIIPVMPLVRNSRIAFAKTQHSMSLLECLAAAVQNGEHVLLTGETGVGKTFLVQYLADQLGQNLIVHNLNQQTDTSDFMGGWKPLDISIPVREVYQLFLDAFSKTFALEKNRPFLDSIQAAVNNSDWSNVLKMMKSGCNTFYKLPSERAHTPEITQEWDNIKLKCGELLGVIKKCSSTFAFTFEEGSLVRAWKEGHWILLDELNLATTEVLERVSSVLGDVDSLFLTDRGSMEPIPRHKNFHVFANMNPPTDVGKKDLPPSLRSRFTEFYVNEPFNHEDIRIVVGEYISFLAIDAKVEEITNFFLECVRTAKTKLCVLDGESKVPSFSLRTLTRALSYVREAAPLYGFPIALFDGLLMAFATPLQRQFHAVVKQLIVDNIFKKKQPPSPTLPPSPGEGKFIPYEHIWIPAGDRTPVTDPSFILTKSVKEHLTNLARAVFVNRPVLLEGPTSSGKSSMVKFLAELTGNHFIRINNHSSTEVQEYLGHYITDEQGKLRFVDGILVTAVRNGYWIVLDELNLAPTDVLEALNRLLDDNRELFIPDTQETIKPHPQLRIFATQNPAGVYGGRQVLSRAFRNRFLEITVDDIPVEELSDILLLRYSLPKSFTEKMVEVMNTLQSRRQGSQIFAGKHGFITPRDLFRWAERKPKTYLELAEHGFLLLGERCRKTAELQTVKDVITSVTKTQIDEDLLYSPDHWPFVEEYYKKVEEGLIDHFNIAWTKSMQRLFTIVGICLEHREPVLLVGETGSSKTTVCQLWAALLGIPLHILNCHQHTEASDFLGCLRPSPLDRQSQSLFEWRNGTLVQSMINGDFFLLDEISLAEDSVLERINSVLEPSRSVTLAEKSSADVIVANDRFRILATMNPGGDFGKRELSPALRNRFTEIYVRPLTDEKEVGFILNKRLTVEPELLSKKMASVLCHVASVTSASGLPQHISIRDVILWVNFMNAACPGCSYHEAFMHGFDAVILDGVGVGTAQSDTSANNIRSILLEKSKSEIGCHNDNCLDKPFWECHTSLSEPILPDSMKGKFFFGAPATQRNLSKLMRASIIKKPVLLEGSPGVGKTSIVEALGCAMGQRVVRINLSEQTDIMDLFGAFLPSPTEESSNSHSNGPQFVWSDGVLLRAVQDGSWVILDELNLANQSVLEGLNALLDHRSTVFIPELNREFQASETFRIFACQNPLIEGGGRKGLPRSFLNRFIKVRIEPFGVSDLVCIATAIYPNIRPIIISQMVEFVGDLQNEVMVRRSFGSRGSPWEFNLRDVLRWASLMERYSLHESPSSFANILFLRRMRSDEDMKKCLELLIKHFGSLHIPKACNSDILILDDKIYFQGHFLATRFDREANTKELPTTLLLPSQADTVKNILMCAEQNQFCLLVGPSGSGKTFSLRTAAAIAGAKLMTFSMNSSCDTVDLLGGFDQVEGKQGNFEWRDSLILEAMLQGHWLVLDNANYCNASVLDRLNPLVEPGGVLSVNEQGLVNNELRTIHPHSKFRLFATLNPKYGEISRAMRNRAVELFVSPIPIPSTESLVLCATETTLVDSRALNRLLQYHSKFVEIAFHSDTTRPMSPMFNDALASGAPNLFTLLKAVLLADPSKHVEDAFRDAIAHKYIINRNGPWRNKEDELTALLKSLFESNDSADSNSMLNSLLVSTAQALGNGIDAVDTAQWLLHLRVLRSGLSLHFAVEQLLQGESSEDPINDLVVFFILDQCSDSVPSPALTELRKSYLYHKLQQLGQVDESLFSLINEGFSTKSLQGGLWCKAMLQIGHQASEMKDLMMPSTFVSQSSLLSTCVNRLFPLLGSWLSTALCPFSFEKAVCALAPLVRTLKNPSITISAQNYIVVAVLLSILLDTVQEIESMKSTAIHHCVIEFCKELQKYLSLPYSLLGEGCIISGCVPSPHITTPDERSIYDQWRVVSSSPQEETPMFQYMKPLWKCAAFRSEFQLVQVLLEYYGTGMRATLQNLINSVGRFITSYTKEMPLFSVVETIVWESLRLEISNAKSLETSVGEFMPLLLTRFMTRYQLDDSYSMFPGSWISHTAKALRYVQTISAGSMGPGKEKHFSILGALSTFFTQCPILGVDPFSRLEENALRDFKTFMECCFPEIKKSVSPDAPLPSWIKVAHDALMSPSNTFVCKEHHALMLMILKELAHAKSDRFYLMILIWSLKCRLLLPLTPIDPMVKKSTLIENLKKQSESFQSFHRAFESSEKISLRSGSAQSELLAGLQAQNDASLVDASQKYVVRPDTTGNQYARMVRDMYAMCSSLLCDSRLDSISADFAARFSWCELVYQQAATILEHNGGYEDVVLNFAQAAFEASFSARLSCFAQGAQGEDTLLGFYATLEQLQFFHIKAGITCPLPVQGTNRMRHRLQYLDSCLYIITGYVPHAVYTSFVDALFASYRNLYKNVEFLEEEERKQENLAYKYKEKALVIEGDDERAMKRLKALFPSYEQDFNEKHDQEEEEEEEEGDEEQVEGLKSDTFSEQQGQSIRHARILFHGKDSAYIHRLVSAHYSYYQRVLGYLLEPSIDEEHMLRHFTSRFDTLTEDLGRSKALMISEDTEKVEEKLLLNGFLSRAAVLKKEIDATGKTLEEKKNSGFNVFWDPEPHEVSLLSVPLAKLMSAIESLLGNWPDSSCLQRCKSLGEKIAKLPALSTPLMKLMTGCEILLRECYEWERNAPKEFSIIEHMNQLSSLILKWRRLELHCWGHVFIAKRKELELKASFPWFTFYDLIRVEETDPDSVQEHSLAIFETFSEYMWSSNLGDFSHRLRIVRAFAYELIVRKGLDSPLARISMNVAEFFAQFEELIETESKKEVSPIEEDMESFSRIMRWEDATYYAVRATTEKSHLQVARSLAKLEEVLSKSIRSVVSADEIRCEDNSAMGFSLPQPEEEKKKSKSNAPKCPPSQAKRTRVGQIVPRQGVKNVGSPNELNESEKVLKWSCDSLKQGMEFFEYASEQIVSNVHSLQQPGVKVNTKTRSLKTLLDTMDEAGIPHTHLAQAGEWESVFASTNSLLACRNLSYKEANWETLQKSSSQFYRFVRWLQRLRGAEKDPHNDLTAAQVNKCTGFTESVFAHSIDLCQLICLLFKMQLTLHKISLVLTPQTSAKENRYSDPLRTKIFLHDCFQLCSSLKTFYCSLTWMKSERLVDISEIATPIFLELNEKISTFWSLCVQNEPLRRDSAPSVPLSLSRKYEEMLKSVNDVLARLREHSDATISSLITQFMAQIALIPNATKLENENNATRRKRQREPEDFLSSIKSIFASIEKTYIEDYLNEELPLGDDSSGQQKEYANYVAELSHLRSDTQRILADVEAAYQALGSSMPAPAQVKSLLDCISLSQKTLDDVKSSLSISLYSHSHFGIVIARLFCILIKKGFCKSEDDKEDEEEGEGDGEQQDGTGMDDGKGEKDVTDEIENEDQLMNMKDKNEEQKEEEQEGNENDADNAADVETDFNGNKEKRNEEEGDDDEEDEGESDLEMGEVDGEEEQDRKKSRKDKNDNNEMDEDEGGQAEEVPKDELADQDENEEETGGFENKEEQIRNGEELSGDEHELMADENNENINDDASDSSGGTRSELSSGDGESDTDDLDGDRSDDNLENEEQEAGSSTKEEGDGSNSETESDASTDNDRDPRGEAEIDQEDESGSESDDLDENSDAPDQNVYHGGHQDEHEGEEATEQKEDTKEKKKSAQPNTAASEEEQPGNEQEQDDAGRNYKANKLNKQDSHQKNNKENNSSQSNPYRAIKEALQRHQRQMKQLNLDNHVKVTDQPGSDDDNDDRNNNGNDESDQSVGEFEFDEEGEMEGVAATEERFVEATEAKDDLENAENEDNESQAEENGEAPEDVRRRREKDADEMDQVQDENSNATKKSQKNKKRVQSAPDARESDEESSISEETDEGDNLALENQKIENGRKLWQDQEVAVQGLSQQLCEQLRLILAPTLADKLQGDYKTGKRLNMKRIIPYIASQYKKDRIWLRRTKPNKRVYQLMVALDDSSSMQHNYAGVMSCRAVALIAKALQQLEVGEISIACFGEKTHVVHDFEEPFVGESGARAFSEVTFSQNSTSLKNFLTTSLDYLDSARERVSGQTRSTVQKLQQIIFIISDGQVTEDRTEIKKLLLRAEENHQMIVFVLLDKTSEKESSNADNSSTKQVLPTLTPKDLKGLSTAERMRRLKSERDNRLKRVQSNSICNLQRVEFKDGKVVIRSHMEDFPFPYYLIISDLQQLPEMIADAMRQWFELSNIN